MFSASMMGSDYMADRIHYGGEWKWAKKVTDLLNEGGGGGLVDDVKVNGTSVVDENKVAQIDLTPYAESADLATVATSGSYDDLSNKPTIPAAQVQSDWLEADTSAKSYILNKPTIPSAQVQSDWNEADSSAVDYIKNKPSIPSTASDVGAYTTSQVDALLDNKVDKTDGIVYGGTLSSSETIDLNDAQFRTSKARTIYWLQIGSNTSNAPISSGYGNLECHHYMQRFTTYSSGRTYIRWYVNNVWSAWKEINTTYTFEEGSVNGAFSVTPSGGSAQSVPIHGLGEYTTKDGSSTNVATGTYTTLTSLAITAGTYLVEYQASFAANANGMRRIFITQSSSSSSANPQFSYINVQNTGASYGTALNGMVIVKTSASATLYLRAYHDAGTTLSVTGRIGTVRIK